MNSGPNVWVMLMWYCPFLNDSVPDMNYTSQLHIFHSSFVFSHINKCPQCAEFHLKVHLVVSLVIGVHSHEKTEGIRMKAKDFPTQILLQVEVGHVDSFTALTENDFRKLFGVSCASFILLIYWKCDRIFTRPSHKIPDCIRFLRRWRYFARWIPPYKGMWPYRKTKR